MTEIFEWIIRFIKKYNTNWRNYTMTDMEWNIQERLDKDLLDRKED